MQQVRRYGVEHLLCMANQVHTSIQNPSRRRDNNNEHPVTRQQRSQTTMYASSQHP